MVRVQETVWCSLKDREFCIPRCKGNLERRCANKKTGLSKQATKKSPQDKLRILVEASK